MVKKRESKKAKSMERKITRELLWVLVFMIFLVLVFVVVSDIFKSFNAFEYAGLTFTKEISKVGEIPVFHYYYYFYNKQDKFIQYNLYLRVDPRDNPVRIEGEKIFMDNDDVVFISNFRDTWLDSCDYGVLGIANLASFLRDNDFVVRGGNLDFHDAKAKGEDWITCDTKPYNPVIKIVEGSESKITISENCYEISISSCEDFLAATEKFTLQSLLDARERNNLN